MLMITALAIALGAVAQEARPERTQIIIATQETPGAFVATQDGR